MSKKKFKAAIRDSDAFDLLDASSAAADTSVHAIDEKLFGVLEQSDMHRQSADPVSIFEVHADSAQPRRAIPNKVREAAEWDGDLQQMGTLFLTWEKLVNEERQRLKQPAVFNLKRCLNQDVIGDVDVEDVKSGEEEPLSEEIGPLEKALVSLVELATSIYAEGLANPITVFGIPGRGYVIETGERRWLAYHLLYWHTGDKRYSKIAGRTVDGLNIWRQAAENNARANLNAISKARQFAVLLMDLLREEKGILFTPRNEFKSHEQGYYAQVAEGEEYRVPRGTGERLLQAIGLKSGKQLREYRALLRLPKIVWEIADDLNWPERAIRDLMNRSMNNDDLVDLTIRKAKAEGYSVPMGTVAMERGTKKPGKKKVDKTPLAPNDKRYYGQFLKLLSQAKAGKTVAREKAFARIEEIRRWLDEQEEQLSH